MAPLIAIDARDAAAAQLRGWGRYAARLVEALEAAAPHGLELEPITHGWKAPEVLYEQLGLPLLLRRRGAALVHTTNCFLPLARSCPGIVTIHDLAFEEWPADFATATRLKYRTLTPLAARSAQRVICPSIFTAEDVCRRYRLDRGKVRVIPEAPALAPGDDAPPAGRYVLAVGDLRKKKNLVALVSAFVAVRRRAQLPHRLVLAGTDAGEGDRLKATADTEPVELAGYVTDERLDALIRGAELLVHPSRYEGFGLVVLEAMVRGTPVLAARASALPETGGDAAAYFTPGQTTVDLERALHELLVADSAERTRAAMAERGRDHASQFSWSRTAAETLAVYRELLT